MKPKTTKNSTNEFLKRHPQSFILSILTISLCLTACASINRKDESIHTILQKENALIEKLQAERAQPEVAQAISENASLTKAEAHLRLALEELISANKTIKNKILKTNKKEVGDGEN